MHMDGAMCKIMRILTLGMQNSARKGPQTWGLDRADRWSRDMADIQRLGQLRCITGAEVSS